MKKLLALSLITISLSFPGRAEASPSATESANTASSSASRIERIQTLKETIAARKNLLLQQKESKKEENQNRLSERRRIRIRNLYQLMRRRIAAAISRLSKITARLETRLSLMTEEGLDIQTASPLVTEAKTKLAEATASLEAIDGGLEDVLTSEDPLANFREVKELIKETHLLLVDIHQLLWKAAQAVKIPLGEIVPEASRSGSN